MANVLFVGGGLDSASASSVGVQETTGFNDTTYAPSALSPNNGQITYAIYTCLDPATLAPTTVVGGQTFFGHFSWNFTNPYNTGQNMCFIRDSAGNPWVAIRCNGGSPNFGLYYNSGTGGAPVWTQIGANFSMPQNTAPYQRLDIRIDIGGAGNHNVLVYNKEVLQASGPFTAAGFTNVRDVQIFGGTGFCMIWEVAMTEGISTVGAHVGYALATGAGTNAGWTGTFNQINPAVCTDATQNSSAVAAQKTTYAWGDVVVPATNTIREVWQWMRAKNDGSNPSNIKAVTRSAGTDYPQAANAPGISNVFGAIPARWPVDPATGVQWIQAGFNAAEFGFLSAA